MPFTHFCIRACFADTALQLNISAPAGENGNRAPKALPGSTLAAVVDWPSKETQAKLGQLSGVSIDIYGNAVIFHRGDRVWNGMTFNK